MSKKRRQGRQRRTRPRRPTSSRPTSGIQFVTPEGDEIVFASVHYQHSALEEIRQILKQADDFDGDLQPEPNDSVVFSWLETRSGGRSQLAPLGQRILATLTLTPTALEVEAMSQQRLDNCCRRLEELLGARVHLIETQTKSADQALREGEPGGEKPFIPPPEVVAEIEEQMLRRWIDESVPALGGLTPREAVKTPEGRQQVLELLEYIGQMQKRTPKTPGMFSPDYRKAKKMLGLE
jgi:hypothetical protein